MTELSLDDFVRGILAVLAFEGRQKLVLATGVFDVALVQTLELLEKQMARERIRPAFRLTRTSAKSPRSELRQLLRQLEKDRILAPPTVAGEAWSIVWPRDAAYGWLEDTTVPIGFLDRAGKLFWKQHETFRIRWSLHSIAVRRRDQRTGKDA